MKIKHFLITAVTLGTLCWLPVSFANYHPINVTIDDGTHQPIQIIGESFIDTQGMNFPNLENHIIKSDKSIIATMTFTNVSGKHYPFPLILNFSPEYSMNPANSCSATMLIRWRKEKNDYTFADITPSVSANGQYSCSITLTDDYDVIVSITPQ